MPGDLVEVVARAIWIQSGFGPDGWNPENIMQKPYLGKARAALKSIEDAGYNIQQPAKQMSAQELAVSDAWRATATSIWFLD